VCFIFSSLPGLSFISSFREKERERKKTRKCVGERDIADARDSVRQGERGREHVHQSMCTRASMCKPPCEKGCRRETQQAEENKKQQAEENKKQQAEENKKQQARTKTKCGRDKRV